MAIIVYVGDGFGGYGDFIYGLKTVEALKKNLAKDIGYTEEIFLVSEATGKAKVIGIGGDKEFGVTVLSVEELRELARKKDFKLDFAVEVAALAYDSPVPVFVSETTPILLSSEYSSDPPRELAETKSSQLPSAANNSLSGLNIFQTEKRYNNGKRPVVLVRSGLDIENGENGIFITQSLLSIAQKKQRGDFSFMPQAWRDVGRTLNHVIIGRPVEETSINKYRATTEFHFEYSRNTEPQNGNSCQRYLKIHQLYNKNSKKNQDVLSIGKDTAAKLEAFENELPNLAKHYNKIVFIDIDTKEEHVRHDDGTPQDQAKVFRFLYTRQVDHEKMLALFAVSGDLVGVTGDQSFGEAISAGKAIVYEEPSHKIALLDGYLDVCRSSRDQHLYDLQYQLVRAKDEKDWAKLEELLEKKDVQQTLNSIKQNNLQVAEKYNLGTRIAAAMAKHLTIVSFQESKEKNEGIVINTTHALHRAILTKDTAAALKLIHEDADFTKPTNLGSNALLMAVQERQWQVFAVMIDHAIRRQTEFYSQESKQESKAKQKSDVANPFDVLTRALTFKNAVGQSAIDSIFSSKKFLKEFEERCPPGSQALKVCTLIQLQQNIKNICAEYKPVKKGDVFVNKNYTKHLEQKALLEMISQFSLMTPNPNVKFSREVMVGALLLVRASIKREQGIFGRWPHSQKLKEQIKEELIRLGFTFPRSQESQEQKDYVQESYRALRTFAETQPGLQGNKSLFNDLNQFIKLQSPLELPKDSIQHYLKIIAARQEAKNISAPTSPESKNLSEAQPVDKISRKEESLKKLHLPFSVLKIPQSKGFYLLCPGKGKLLGEGEWGKVKRAYYCDENGNIDRRPIAMKITTKKKKSVAAMVKEMGMFGKAHQANRQTQTSADQKEQPTQDLYKAMIRNKKIYLPFPELPGKDLTRVLAEDKLAENKLDNIDRLKIAKAVVQALMQVHTAGVVHLDVSLWNIRYDKQNNSAYFYDFGCSEEYKEDVGKQITFCNPRNGKGKFSEEYAPPEFGKEFGGKCKLHPSLDVYSLGVVLGEIMGIPLEDLTAGKINRASLKAFNFSSPKGSYFPNYQLYDSAKGQQFIEAFMSDKDYDFDFEQRLDPKMVELLRKMTARDPQQRLSLMEVEKVLTQMIGLQAKELKDLSGPKDEKDLRQQATPPKQPKEPEKEVSTTFRLT